MKKILITGAGSYIGTAVEALLSLNPEQYEVDTLSLRDENWKEYPFENYDVVFHAAGIAHADVEKATDEQKKQYYAVNTDLAVETAQRAKDAGVRQFIFMSSMIVYSGCAEKVITRDTQPSPANFYGDSKWQADQKIRALSSDSFKVAVLRPPMIYGRGSKGNYPMLAKLAEKLPVFPKVKNQRSMIYIGNFCAFVKLVIDNEESGVFFPQNGEYTNTSEMVRMIAKAKNHKLLLVPGFSWIIGLMKKIPGKIGNLAEKAFGDLVYDMDMSRYPQNYRVYSLEESVNLTENSEQH